MRTLRHLTWLELKLFAREPLTVLFVVVLPVAVLYILNGVFGDQPDPEVWEGLSAVDFYTAAYVALVVATVGVLSLPTHLAGYRERGVLRRFRASVIPPAAVLGAHVAVTVLISTVGGMVVTVASWLAYGATLPGSWPGVLVAFLLTALSFAALGILLGLVMPTARAAQGLGVLLFFVFMMLGGAGPPREVLPEAMGRIGDVLPMTHAARLLREPWLTDSWDWGAFTVVVGVLVGSTALTAWRWRTE